MNQDTESREKEIKEPNGNRDVAFREFNIKTLFSDLVSLFLVTISLFLTAGLLWKLTHYISENSDQIIELSLGDIASQIVNYSEYIYPLSIIFYTLLFFVFLIGLYSVLGFFKHVIGKKGENNVKSNEEIIKRKKLIKIKLLSIIGLFFIMVILCFIFLSPSLKELLKPNELILIKILLLSLLIYWSIQLSEKINHLNLFRNIKEYMQENRWSMGLFIYSVIFYYIICFFFTETQGTQTGNHAGVFILPGIAIVISIGFFICATILQSIVGINKEILEFLDINIGERHDRIIEDLKRNIKSFLANFLVAISGYIFLRSILNIISTKELIISNLLHILEQNLSIILLIPLYFFFYQVVSSMLENIYEKIYDICERPTGLNPFEEGGKKNVVNTFVRLTKVLIVIFIIISIVTQFVDLGEILGFLFEPPISYVVGTGIAIPIALWFLVLILDPFFEGETIEIDSHRGKIKKVGFFFTNLETMTGEQVYIPNAELLAKTIRRLHARNPPGEREEGDEYEAEKGMMVYFSCTLSYAYKPKEIEKVFVRLFEENGKKEFKIYIGEGDFNVSDEEIEYIFSEKSHPFVFIEDFKDYGVVYRFNFRVRDSLYAPFLRGYFMKIFKNRMDQNCKPIVTPVKFEIRDIGEKEFRF
jgi:hypothetical protein